MNPRLLVAILPLWLASAQTRVTAFDSVDVDAIAKSDARVVELNGRALPTELAAVRAVRDQLAKAGIAVHSVAWTLDRNENVRQKLTVANALDVRYVVVTCPALLAPKLNTESVTTGVPVALRNGAEGLQTPDEIIAVLRTNSHLRVALDAARMLADGHDPGVFVKRAARRLSTVYLDPDLDASAKASLTRALRTNKVQASFTVTARAR